MKLVYLLLAAVVIGGNSCSKEHSQPAGLVGTWNWVYSSGGIAGITETPASTGQTRSMEYTANGQFQSDINGNLRYGQYQIVTASCIHNGGTTNQVKYSNGLSQTFVSTHDSLILDDEVYDGFRSIYVHR